jgi:hypothetical protein
MEVQQDVISASMRQIFCVVGMNGGGLMRDEDHESDYHHGIHGNVALSEKPYSILKT